MRPWSCAHDRRLRRPGWPGNFADIHRRAVESSRLRFKSAPNILCGVRSCVSALRSEIAALGGILLGLVAVVLCVSCERGPSRPKALAEPGSVLEPSSSGPSCSVSTDGMFVPRGAPHPLECASDSDCQPYPFVNPRNGCCDSGVTQTVFGRDYSEWRTGWVRERCHDVQCPMLPPPAPPRPCALLGRCVQGCCQDRCGG